MDSQVGGFWVARVVREEGKERVASGAVGVQRTSTTNKNRSNDSRKTAAQIKGADHLRRVEEEGTQGTALNHKGEKTREARWGCLERGKEGDQELLTLAMIVVATLCLMQGSLPK